MHISQILRNARFLRWCAATIVGCLIALSYYTRFGQARVTTTLDHGIVLLYFALLFTGASYLLLFRWLMPRLRSLPRASCLAWVVGTLAFSSAVVYADLLASAPPTLAQPEPHQLELLATGQKNVVAKDAQVWIIGLYNTEDQPIPLTTFTHDPGWTIQDDKLAFLGAQPATALWSGTLRGNAELRLVSHAWSGIVRITWDGQSQVVDLFNGAPTNATQTIQLAGSRLTAASRIALLTPYEWLRAAADLLSLSLLAAALALVVNWLRRRLAWGTDLRSRVFVVMAAMALPLAALVASILFGRIEPAASLRASDYAIALLYVLFALGVAACFLIPEKRFLRVLLRPLPQHLRWLTANFLGQTKGAWLAALVGCAIVSAVLVDRLGVGGSQALWARLAVDGPSDAPPTVSLRYGPADGDVVPFAWQPYAETLVAVRPRSGSALPIIVLRVETDAGPVDLKDVQASRSTMISDGIALSDPEGSLLRWPHPSRALTVTLGAGPGTAEVIWLDQHQEVRLGQGDALAAFRLPAAFQGWALLPPRPISQLALEMVSPKRPYIIRNLDIPFDANGAIQSWDANAAGAWQTRGCAAQRTVSGMSLSVASDASCAIQMQPVTPFNTSDRGTQIAAWLIIAALLAIALRLILWVSSAYQRWSAGYRRVDTGLGARVRTATRGWSAGWVMLTVWLVALAWGLIYLSSVPMTYSYDTLDYLGVAHAIVETGRFSGSLGSTRTPGYPLFLAVVSGLFDSFAIGTTFVQHMALAALAPLTVWATYRRLSLLPAALIGMFVAISPAISMSANHLLTELPFTFLSTAALLVYLRHGRHLRSNIIIGTLIGIATMVRPTGLLLLAVFAGWHVLRFWCATRRPHQLRAALAAAGLVAGYLVTAAPWHLHLAVVRKTTDLSQGLAGFTAWAGAVYQRRMTDDLPSNLPDRALWSVTHIWDYNPFPALNQPQIVPNGILERTVYQTQALSEANRRHLDRYLDVMRLAMVYNLTLVRPEPGASPYIIWNELTNTLRGWEGSVQPRQAPFGTGELRAIQQQIEQQIDEAYQVSPPLRTFSIGLTRFVLEHWYWLTILALLCTPFLLARATLRPLAPAWLYWIGVVVSTSAIGFPADRYMIVVEPMLYIMVGMTFTALACSRYQPNKAALSVDPSANFIVRG
jgi:hypothetical protein